MPLKIADRVQETSAVVGTVDAVLTGAKQGYRTFASVLSDTDTTYYTITDTTGAWEVGLGTYTSATNMLGRTTVLASSSGGAKVDFAAGTKDIFISAAAAMLPPEPVRVFRTTVNTAANTATTVAHNLSLPNKDEFVIRVADSTGQDVGVRVVSVDVNSLQITTSVPATGLIVTVAGV